MPTGTNSSSNKGVQAFRRSGRVPAQRAGTRAAGGAFGSGTHEAGDGAWVGWPERLNARTPERLNAPRPERLTPGFTLIELMVVLIGLAVVAAAVVPALRGAGHQADLTGIAARVAASARFARDEAVQRQAAIVLTADTAAVRLVVDNQQAIGVSGPGMMGAAGTMGGPSPLLPLPSAFALVTLSPRVHARLEALPETLNGSAQAAPASGADLQMLRFPADGRTTGGLVLLTDDRGHTVRVAVTPDTGVVRVETGNG